MIQKLIERYPSLYVSKEDIEKAAAMLIDCFERGGKLLTCGNGGSAADSEHIVGELMKGFLKKRPLSDEKKSAMKELFPSLDDDITENLQGGLPAISLPHFSGLNTAFANDVKSNLVYAQTLFVLGKKEDVLMCLSTSGNSENIVAAAKTARSLGIEVISITGKSGGKLKELSDICICLDEEETFLIQELCLPVYHFLCAAVEEYFFKT